MLSMDSSSTLQPMARADSSANVMFSFNASVLWDSDAEEDIFVKARKSTVFGTDLLTSLLLYRSVCVGVCMWSEINNCLYKSPCLAKCKNGYQFSQDQ